MWSFDTVSIDSDLDSVCTEQVRQHIHRRPGERLHKNIEKKLMKSDLDQQVHGLL